MVGRPILYPILRNVESRESIDPAADQHSHATSFFASSTVARLDYRRWSIGFVPVPKHGPTQSSPALPIPPLRRPGLVVLASSLRIRSLRRPFHRPTM
jgi:hypothetical protein